MPDTVQLRESARARFRGAVARKAPCMFVVNADGNRNIPYANDDGKRWNGNWNWISNDFNRNGRVAVARNWQ